MLRSAATVLSLLLPLILSARGLADEQKTLNATVVEPKTEQKADAKSAEKPAAAAPGTPFTDTSCTQGKNTRSVTITYGAANKLPCEVHYKKDTEKPGSDTVVYKAANEASFCDAKAHAFVDKLAGMGWTCGGKS